MQSHQWAASPSITRRQLVQIGGLGMLGLGLPQLLQASASAPRSGRGSEKSCIFIFQYGGLSQLDSWDSKPNAPDTMRGPYKPVATSVPGTQICELLPRLAQLTDRYCLLRSLTHREATHEPAQHISLSGQSAPPGDAPHFGSIVAKLRPAKRHVLSNVWLQAMLGAATPHYRGGGFMGSLYAPFMTEASAQQQAAAAFQTDLPLPRLEERRQLLDRLAPASTTPAASAEDATLRRFQRQAFEVLTRPHVGQSFNLEHEPLKLRERYGRHPLGQNLLLARRLVEAGVRLVTINAWMGVSPGFGMASNATWDMHGGVQGVDSIFGTGTYGLGFALPRLDQAVSAFLEDLEQRGLLQDTLVVLVGEFGRTPKVSTKGAAGREHWPNCYSALLAGAGIRGGAVWGASDRIGAYVQDRPVSPEDFGATLLYALGVPPHTRLSPDGATRAASTGQPIESLFS
jgi:uncharacterized protein (DUF1501 family)